MKAVSADEKKADSSSNMTRIISRPTTPGSKMFTLLFELLSLIINIIGNFINIL